MWREYIEGLTEGNPNSNCIFTRGATPVKIEDVESQLAVQLPVCLKTLLEETNGVIWEIILRDGDEFALDLIWGTEQIIKENLYIRDPKNFVMSWNSEGLLFFGSEGNGNSFVFQVTEGQVLDESVFVWSHEDDSLEKTSCSLREHLEVLKNFKVVPNSHGY